MSNENTPVVPNPVFRVASAEGGFSANADYPFFNEITSEDESIAISGQTPADLSVTITADGTVSGVMQFELVDEGLHRLQINTQTEGIICLRSGSMSVHPFPGGRAVLCCDENNNLQWVMAPGEGEYAFGVQGGSWRWYPVDQCDDACSDE